MTANTLRRYLPVGCKVLNPQVIRVSTEDAIQHLSQHLNMQLIGVLHQCGHLLYIPVMDKDGIRVPRRSGEYEHAPTLQEAYNRFDEIADEWFVAFTGTRTVYTGGVSERFPNRGPNFRYMARQQGLDVDNKSVMFFDPSGYNLQNTHKGKGMAKYSIYHMDLSIPTEALRNVMWRDEKDYKVVVVWEPSYTRKDYDIELALQEIRRLQPEDDYELENLLRNLNLTYLFNIIRSILAVERNGGEVEL